MHLPIPKRRPFFISAACIALGCPLFPAPLPGRENPDATAIVREAERKFRGKSSRAEITIEVVRPTWTREMGIKTWQKGTGYTMILVTAPPREKGTAFLKRGREIWTWMPSIERVVKLPPSMMGQSWMGTDFTNDDLVREGSPVEDYTHEIAADTVIDGRAAWKITLRPKPEAPVVWGRILVWITKQEHLQLRTEFYDGEDGLVNVMEASDIREIGGRILPTRLVMIPADEEGHRTVMRYGDIEFDIDISEDFFTLRNLKSLR